MDISDTQKKIDETDYWDLLILDVEIKFFGDEIYLFIEKDNQTCWKISFNSCYKVKYETDANWRGDFKVKNIGPTSGYYGQNISLEKYEEGELDGDFTKVSLDLSIMLMTIVCKDIIVEEIKLKDISFFWENK